MSEQLQEINDAELFPVPDQLNGAKLKVQTEVVKAFDFVAKVINSCQDTYQIQCAQRLVEFFRERFYHKHGGKKSHDELLVLLTDRIPFIVSLV